MRILIAIIALFFVSNVYADQCQVLNAAQTSAALGKLNEVKTRLSSSGKALYVAEFCQPCGQAFPKIYPVNEIGKKKWNRFNQEWDGNYEVLINGKAVDTAYIYYFSQIPDSLVDDKKVSYGFSNLAKSASCEAQGVSDYINVNFQHKTGW